MNHYKIIVSYDGTQYCGWQQQQNGTSILGCLQKTFKKLFSQQATFLGASRTDAGVHAVGQVVLLKTSLVIDSASLLRVWNNALPADILIRSITQVSKQFHPWYGVAYKDYYYFLCTRRPLPFLARFVWQYPYGIDHEKLNKALQLFVGTHDFKAFIAAGEQRETVRTIESIQVFYYKRFGVYRIAVRGTSFGRHLIRRIVGAAVMVACKHNISTDSIKHALESKNPNHALFKAPASGLVLRKIVYR